ncbi:MAG: hypothetical protein MMC33_010908 [Icmadophila ericetorum]|nr:hypothetical protein [Icmadophila ericetorum]
MSRKGQSLPGQTFIHAHLHSAEITAIRDYPNSSLQLLQFAQHLGVMQQEDADEEEVDYDFDEQADDLTGRGDAGTGSSSTAPAFWIFRTSCDLP